MPVQLNKDINGCYARWGNEGAKYYYKCDSLLSRDNAKKKAIKQGVAIGDFSNYKISLDFDDTLSTDKGKELATRLIKEGNNVYIITRRQEMFGSQVYEVAKELGIPRDKIYFTNGKLKWETVKRLGIDIHYDNNKNEVDKINELTDTKGVLFNK